MSREIKFRAWLKKEKRMLDKVALTWPGSEMIIQWYDSLDDYYAGALSDCAERDAEVMQYTGLEDRNGREIYEGDIWENGIPRVVEFREDRAGWFPFATDDGCGCCSSETYQPEHGSVIGNIYENPELLGEVAKAE
ncbi:YopX family protein [Paenibacillus sp. sgz500958]|uniref:YopX family protein n=1 Tax=Paenibacillus sp. sgz500958 TaxID=3242475 RepID=UPI0036D41A83